MKYLILISSIFIFSCVSNKVKFNNQQLPKWVVKPNFDGKIAGVGVAPKSNGGYAVQHPIAKTNAIGNLAQRIQAKVSQLSKSALEQAKTNKLGDDFHSTFQQATIIKVQELPLSGIIQVNMTQINDELYVRVALDEKDYSKYIKNIQKTLNKKLAETKLSQEQIKKGIALTKPIFEELQKNVL